MKISSGFLKTEKQKQQMELISGAASQTLAYGGGRSGKTAGFCYATGVRACRIPSRHLILRAHLNHARTSLFMDTLPKVFGLAFPGLKIIPSKSDSIFTFPNKSELWVGGLDDKERTDKILGTEYCVDPNSLVLKANLEWARARSLKVGDELIGFPENLDGHLKLIRSVVEKNDKTRMKKYRIITDKGETIVSENHRFVTYFDDRRNINFSSLSWRTAGQLCEGDRLKYFCKPWEANRSWEAGWLAGILDGEGWISGGRDGVANLGVAQNKGLVLDEIKRIYQLYEISFREHAQNKSDVCTSILCKGSIAALRLMGVVKPKRLFLKSDKIWENKSLFVGQSPTERWANVLKIECLGVDNVIALGTSTKTFISDGFLSHNSTIYFNEISQMSYESVLTAQTRLAQKNILTKRMYYDMNPTSKKHWGYKLFIEKKDPESGLFLKNPEDYSFIQMNPVDNIQNIDEKYLLRLENLPASKKKRFYDGEFSEERIGAVFNTGKIKRVDELPKDMDRIVVGYDPAVTSKITSDEHGIIVCGRKGDQGFVISDHSGIYTPQEAAMVVCKAYRESNADLIVGETNNGGDYIEAVLRSVDQFINYKSVHATRGKVKRAEPIAALYEQGKIHHVGFLPDLESEMDDFVVDEGEMTYSPNRTDALVWSKAELFNLYDVEPMARYI